MGKENMQNKKPMILVLAGPNGSGKSTITAFFDKVGKYTNADDVAALTASTALSSISLSDSVNVLFSSSLDTTFIILSLLVLTVVI